MPKRHPRSVDAQVIISGDVWLRTPVALHSANDDGIQRLERMRMNFAEAVHQMLDVEILLPPNPCGAEALCSDPACGI